MVPRLAIPALTFRAPGGAIDRTATAAYATKATATWLSTFILSGTTTQGASFSVAERAATLDLWLGLTTPDRLLACCWEPADVVEATRRGIRPLVAMRAITSPRAAMAFLQGLAESAYVYSHPAHSPTVLDLDLVRAARAAGVLPAGAKISKIPTGGTAALREAAGPDFDLWDGSSRRITESLRAGASGVVSAPLAALPAPFPAPDDGLQSVVDELQQALDGVAEPARADWLRARAQGARALEDR